MRIVIDAMGSDNAPGVEVEGAIQAVKAYKDVTVILVGKEDEIHNLFDEKKVRSKYRSRLQVVNATEVVTMSDSPAQAFKQKPDSSINVAARLIKDGKGDALVSAGNTGSVVVTSLLGIGRIPGVKRPAILAPIPSRKGHTAVLDAGANVDCKPEHLAQFAIMGELFAKHIFKIDNPIVGTISVGEEDGKGNENTKETMKLIRTLDVNYKGNVEGRDVTSGVVDVIVCDGFVGNVILKTAEGVGDLLFSAIKKEVRKGIGIRFLGAILMRGAFKAIKKQINPDEYGGAPLIGIKSPVIISHGSARPLAIKNAVGVAAKFIRDHINEEIEESVKNLEAGSD